MSGHVLQVDHLVGLNGADRGPAEIAIGPSGVIASVHPPSGPQANGSPVISAVPLLADAHAHLGISDGIQDGPEFHTLEHVDTQLAHLAGRGVGHVHSLGTDQPWLQDRLWRRLDSRDPGDRAFGYSAGVGFGAVDGWPPELTLPELRFRPTRADVARGQVRELASLCCRTLKVWVDDFDGTVPKTPVEVVEAILAEAREHGIITFAHIKTHEDAEALVDLGINVLAHSVRDRVMEAGLLDRMAVQGTALVPTLAREEAEVAFSSAQNAYFHHAFFLSSEHQLVPRLRNRRFSDDRDTPRRRLEIALENIARASARGVPIGLGTDSGFAMKLLGFAQHRELELLSEAGLTAAQCLRAALSTNQRLFASALTEIANGAPASFFVVDGNPTKEVSATQRIREVWIAGKRLSDTSLPASPASAANSGVNPAAATADP